MKLLTVCIFLLPLMAFGGTYNCHFESNQGDGTLQLKIIAKEASVKLRYNKRTYKYFDCSSEKDDIGTLIDCNTGNLDFMLLLNRNISPASGGIMSSTHNLFVDLDC